MTNNEQTDALLERAANLPRTLEPQPELWDRIEAELGPAVSADPQPVQTPYRWWAIAAVGLFGIALATLAFRSAPPVPEVAALPQDPLMRTQLTQLLDAQLDDLPEDVRTTVLDNLKIIVKARNEIREALAENPNNALLQSLYLNSYASERTLLKDVEALARQNKRRIQL